MAQIRPSSASNRASVVQSAPRPRPSCRVTRGRHVPRATVVVLLAASALFSATTVVAEDYTLGIILEPTVTVNSSGFIDDTTSESVNVSGTADAIVGLPAPSSAFELAVAEVNRRDDILPNSTLRLVANSSMYSPQVARQAAYWQVQTLSPKPVALLGTWFYETTEAVASIASLTTTPLISSAASADELSDLQKYPMFIRATVSDSSTAQSILALCKHFDWAKIAFVHSTSATGTALKVRTEALGIERGVEIGGFSYPTSPDSSVRATGIFAMLARLKLSPYRVIVLALDVSTHLEVFRGWYLGGMHTQGYTLIGTEAWTSDIVTLLPRLDPGSTAVAKLVLKGLIYLSSTSPNRTSTIEATRYSDLSARFYKNTTTAVATLRTLSPTAQRSWDSVFLIAHAIDRLVARGGDPRDGAALKSEILQTSFAGASGTVEFDTIKAELKVPWNVYSWHDRGDATDPDTARLVGTYSASTDEFSIDTPITWVDGTQNVPLDHFVTRTEATPDAEGAPAAIEVRHTSIWAQWMAIVLAGVGTLLIVIHAIGLCVYRKTPIFRAASASLLWLVLLGAFFGMVSLVVVALDYNKGNPLGLSQANVDTLCSVQPFVVGSAFTLIFGVLFAIAFRISAIFTTAVVKTSGVVISDRKLLSMVLSIWAVDQLINVAWVLVNKPSHTIQSVSGSESIGYSSCTGSSSSGWLLTSIVYKAFLLLITLHRAFVTRNVPNAFNSSAIMAIATYNVSLFSLVVVPLSIFAAENLAFAQPFRILALFFCSMSIVALLIGQKIYVALFRPDLNKVEGTGISSARKSRAAGGSSTLRDSSTADSRAIEMRGTK